MIRGERNRCKGASEKICDLLSEKNDVEYSGTDKDDRTSNDRHEAVAVIDVCVYKVSGGLVVNVCCDGRWAASRRATPI